MVQRSSANQSRVRKEYGTTIIADIIPIHLENVYLTRRKRV